MWREKRRAIRHAAAHLMVSENSARDLERIYSLPAGHTYVAHCGVRKSFRRPEAGEAARLRAKFDLGEGPYLLMVGERSGFGGYKNGELLFRSIGRMPDRERYTIVCVGGQPLIEPDFRRAAAGARILRLALDDAELRAAYGDAHALIYPSRYEGFGMPVVEAMACGAPVIACRNSSVVEIAGDAAQFVGEDDVEGMQVAIERLCDPSVRADFIARGVKRAPQFSFSSMAEKVAAALMETHERLTSGALMHPSAAWQDLREIQRDAQSLRTFGRVLTRRIRRAVLQALRSIGLDPDRNHLWVSLRAALRRWQTGWVRN
jgi:glycosyltransferase involved in cell wall biosynthesis